VEDLIKLALKSIWYCPIFHPDLIYTHIDQNSTLPN
jgi:hypothetical protein